MLIGRSDPFTYQDPQDVCAKSPFQVLVVEDDLVHFTYCEHVLRSLYGDALELERAVDCLGAIELLSSGRFDICLLDYMVKDGNAKDVLTRIDFGCVDTPIIVISAFDDRDYMLEALRHGADDYVVKGRFTESDLHRAIQYAIYRKYKELRLRQRALYDPLTGLANRHLFFDRLDEVHRFSTRHGEKYAVMVVDLDRLKHVNDSMGHEAGDRYIRAAANGLVCSMRSSDTVARAGGDEFVAILKNIRDKRSLARLCTQVRDSIAAKAEAEEDLPGPLTCSIGVSVNPDDTQSPAEMLRLADSAMYAVKRQGGNGYRFA
ncbi:diguanylate cyclase/phosphodiesterase (GGDEF & EAL domains) with PAS/PAC sensor(s) [Paramagnetospirillum magnetotacticum MS-1]|uniref:Diguanylate cyclase/phosphodiesterase (GGDEF & EAL domains) with PAS/PAC sensor(S) n=1 Tax=Paramagnetospirillum magnetotacticum MS-1 TaxID=272627 RepID=A0A0C2YTD8_PARME|nr:GGDEF domain-containing response regulator [Paramagnetospirillum magnetotacticum]KIL98418.1 diguanylate cyclase/phosphodiesterase (GGDEF & EAL domains) with PAS/PAC sensor(s) [Paramagnetospirillum magnetotacticum MS-1]